MLDHYVHIVDEVHRTFHDDDEQDWIDHCRHRHHHRCPDRCRLIEVRFHYLNDVDDDDYKVLKFHSKSGINNHRLMKLTFYVDMNNLMMMKRMKTMTPNYYLSLE